MSEFCSAAWSFIIEHLKNNLRAAICHGLHRHHVIFSKITVKCHKWLPRKLGNRGDMVEPEANEQKWERLSTECGHYTHNEAMVNTPNLWSASQIYKYLLFIKLLFSTFNSFSYKALFLVELLTNTLPLIYFQSVWLSFFFFEECW